MPTKLRVAALAVLTAFALAAPAGAAARADATSTEERFQDLFVTAGYTTAFGAALGTAFLAFTEEPSENLKYVAIGASLGFIGGSIMGTYVIFSPMVSEDDPAHETGLLAGGPLPQRGIVVRPHYDPVKHEVTAVEGGMTLLDF